LHEDELSSVRKVLSAAALTYVAAMLVAVSQLLRLIILSRRRSS
jgi:Zn-dependent membrane protease YugP